MINADMGIVESNFGPVLQKFDQKQELFNAFQDMPNDQKLERYQKDAFDNMQDWAKVLEFSRPQAVSEEAFTKFIQNKHTELKNIEALIEHS